MLERFPRGVLNFFAGRTINNLVRITSSEEVNQHFQELIAANGIPIVYGNHQGHGDAMALAKISGYLRKLAAQVHVNLHGLAVPMAKSWVSGDQSQELKLSYDLLKEAGQNNGLEPYPITRPQDVARYGMSRKQLTEEWQPFREKLKQGYGLAILPEGSIQGGRHPIGADMERIYGMQQFDNSSLLIFYQLAHKQARSLGGMPFFMPAAFHGSFRMAQSPEDGTLEPRLTKRGKLSLFMGALGLPLGVLKIEARLLMPYTATDIEANLGPDWMENSPVFNRYAMGRIASGLPPIARGVYAIEL